MRLHEARLDELCETLGDLHQLRPGGDRHDDVIRELPVELLGDLEGECFGAFGVVGAQVDVHKGPVRVLPRQLGAQPVDVVVVAVDPQETAAEDRRREHLDGLEIVRDEDDGLHPETGGMGGNRVRQVAGGGAGGYPETQLPRLGEGDGDDAVFEGAGGVSRVVLQVELPESQLGGETIGFHEWREAGIEAGGRLRLHR